MVINKAAIRAQNNPLSNNGRNDAEISFFGGGLSAFFHIIIGLLVCCQIEIGRGHIESADGQTR